MNTRIADKLRKLLALSTNNTSPTEAANAFAAAQALATKHRIELASIELDPDAAAEEMTKEVLNLRTKRVATWKKILVSGIASASGVFVLQSGGTFVFAGRAGDVQTVQYMYAAISAEVDRLCKILAWGRGARYANSFRNGCAVTIRKRLEDASKTTIREARAAGVNEGALVKVEQSADTAKSWYLADTGVKLRKCRGTASRSSDGFAAGERAGRNVNIGGNRAVGRGNLVLGQG